MQRRRDVVPGPDSSEPGPAPVAAVLCLLLVAGSAVPLISGHVIAADRAVAAWSAAHQQPRAFAALDAVTRLARWQWVSLALVAVGGVAAVTRRAVRPLAQTSLAAVLAIVVTAVLKGAVHRPGPTGVEPPAHDGAWPSGHAVTLVVATVLLLRLFPAVRDRRHWIAVAAFLPSLLLGVALIYCGYHWFTDVAVAFPLGLLIAWTALAVERWARRGRPVVSGKPGLESDA